MQQRISLRLFSAEFHNRLLKLLRKAKKTAGALFRISFQFFNPRFCILKHPFGMQNMTFFFILRFFAVFVSAHSDALFQPFITILQRISEISHAGNFR